jgi:curli biogenesis system outer membrane secretion channel CsgG
MRLTALPKVLALLAVVGTGALAEAPAEPGPMATLAVLPLRGLFQLPKPGGPAPAGNARPAPGWAQAQATGGRLVGLEDQINQRVTMAFLKTGRFQLVERADLAAVTKEEKFQQSGLVDDATAARLGHQMGAAWVLVGSYTGSIGHQVEIKTGFFGGKSREDSYPGHLEVRLRLVNAEDGAVFDAILLHAGATDAKPYHAFELLMDDFSASLEKETAARFPMMGYVIKVLSDRQVLVDLGRRQQLGSGTRFQLVEQGEDIVHPVTGKLVKGERRVLTDLKVSDVGDESSVLDVTGARAALKPGQMVVQAR